MRDYKLTTTATNAAPEPQAPALTEALGCRGPCGFSRAGIGWLCDTSGAGPGCGRFVYDSDPAALALAAHFGAPEPQAPAGPVSLRDLMAALATLEGLAELGDDAVPGCALGERGERVVVK